MLRARRLAGIGVGVMVLTSCAPTTQQRDLEFTVARLEQERNGLHARLSSEQARAEALQSRIEAERLEWSATRAEVNQLREQVQRLTEHNQQLQALLDRLKSRPLTRPEVPASPLPPAVDAALAALADRLGGRMWYDRGRGAVSFANDRLFDSGSDAVRPEGQAALRELAGILAAAELATHEVIVVGHTDAAPIANPQTLALHPSNWHLSVHRAIAVKDVLVDAGLSVRRLAVMGYADNRPVSDDPAQNRRVEIFVVPKGAVQDFQPVRP